MARLDLRPAAPRRLAEAAVLCVLALAAFACAANHDVDGVWRAEAPPQGPGNAVLFGPAGANLGIELVIGQFGPDLSGIVRYYPSAEFERARSAAVPDRECECAYLHQGRVDTASGKVAFTLKACVPGGSTTAPLRLRAALVLQADGRLTGTLEVDDPASALDGRLVELAFDRVGQAGDTERSQLACAQPTDETRGNVFSGR